MSDNMLIKQCCIQGREKRIFFLLQDPKVLICYVAPCEQSRLFYGNYISWYFSSFGAAKYCTARVGKQPLSQMISYRNTVDRPCATTSHKRTPIQDIKISQSGKIVAMRDKMLNVRAIQIIV